VTILREESSPLGGNLRYKTAEYSFLFDVTMPDDLVKRAGGHHRASAVVGTLQIEFGVDSRRALFVWGYHPQHNWIAGKVAAPATRQAALLLNPALKLEPGISVPLVGVNEWPTTFDAASGWVHVAPPDSRPDDEIALIADGVAIGELDGQIHSVWLHPAFE